MITREMIRSDKSLAISLHRDMWNWLAENPDKEKSSWPRWRFHGGDVEGSPFYCFCCEHTIHREDDVSNCDNCILVWGKTKDTCIKSSFLGIPLKGMFYKWANSLLGSPIKRAEMARKIANLPERPGV